MLHLVLATILSDCNFLSKLMTNVHGQKFKRGYAINKLTRQPN